MNTPNTEFPTAVTMNSEVTNTNTNTHPCAARGCKLVDHQLYPCAHSKCDRWLHASCAKHVLPRNNPENLSTDSTPCVACRKTCYDKALKNHSRPLNWNEDGANGPNDPNNSEQIVVNWIATEGNYNEYRGNNTEGKTKMDYCSKIADIIKRAGCRVERAPLLVKCKIHHLEKTFKAAYEFAAKRTGSGLEVKDPRSFEDAVKKLCPNYFDVYEAMKDRSSTHPIVTFETQGVRTHVAAITVTGPFAPGGEEEDALSLQPEVVLQVDPRQDGLSDSEVEDKDSEADLEVAAAFESGQTLDTLIRASASGRLSAASGRSSAASGRASLASGRSSAGSSQAAAGGSSATSRHAAAGGPAASARRPLAASGASASDKRAPVTSPPITIRESTKKKARKSQGTPEDFLTAPQLSYFQSTGVRKQKELEETKRHNQAMEAAAKEKDKREIAKNELEIAKNQLGFALERADAIKTIKSKYRDDFTGVQIREMFPQLANFLHDEDFKQG